MTQTAESPGLLTPGDSQTASAASPTDSDESNAPLRLVDVLNLLGYRGDEFISVCHQAPGGEFKGAVMPPDLAQSYVDTLGDTINVWWSINPTSAAAGKGRGTAAQTTRLLDLTADLDVKPGACQDVAHAERIIDELTAELGMEPTAVVYTGHGVQPHWRVADGDITSEFTVAEAGALSRQFGRLVDAVAAKHGAEKVDNVSDLARVMRAPATMNVKSTPVRVVGRRDVGGPLTVSEVAQRLDELGIHRQPDDVTSTEVKSDWHDWQFGEATCSYMMKIIDGLATDGPKPGGGRNPWAASQAVRLSCALRLRCITEPDLRRARGLLEARLAMLLATTERHRPLRRLEIDDLFQLGRRRASEKTDEQARAELGDHHHHHDPADFFGTRAATPGVVGAVTPGVVDSTAPAEPWVPLYASRLLTRSALRNLPKPEPMIEGTLDQGTCAMLYGFRASLKSFIALDWAASVAMGSQWQSRGTKQTRALYVAAEGAHGYPGRFDAWETGWQRNIPDGALDLLPSPVNLMVPAEVQSLGELISWGGYGFVVIDTLARCSVGGEESSSKDMGIVINNLYYLLDQTLDRRGVVLLVHHTGKDGKTLRGSSALDAGLDTVYSATRDGGVVTLNRDKRKDGPELDRIDLCLDPIEGTNSCVLKRASQLSTFGVERPQRAETLLSTFRQHFSTTGAFKTELRKVSDLSEGTFYRAVDDLVGCGDLVNEGTTTRPFYKAVER